MITIITGDIDSGKTRYLKKLYEKDARGDGILSLKHYENGVFYGYDLFHLKSGEQKAFIRSKTQLPEAWDEKYEIGKYSFSEEGFVFAEEVLSNIKTGPVYIDEIGPLELWEKEGFYNILMELINKRRELFLSLRGSLIDDFRNGPGLNEKINIITLK